MEILVKVVREGEEDRNSQKFRSGRKGDVVNGRDKAGRGEVVRRSATVIRIGNRNGSIGAMNDIGQTKVVMKLTNACVGFVQISQVRHDKTFLEIAEEIGKVFPKITVTDIEHVHITPHLSLNRKNHGHHTECHREVYLGRITGKNLLDTERDKFTEISGKVVSKRKVKKVSVPFDTGGIVFSKNFTHKNYC